MKRTITTLAAFLAFASSAVAEDWSTSSSSPSIGTSVSSNASFQQANTEWLMDYEYDYFTAVRGGTLPPEIVRMTTNVSTSSGTSGLSIPNGALIRASCQSDIKGVREFLAPGYIYGVTTKVMTATTCPPSTYAGVFDIPISEFARSSTVDNLGTQVGAVSANLSQLTQELASLQSSTAAANASLSGQISNIAARVSAVEGSLSGLATQSSVSALAAEIANTGTQLAALQDQVSGLADFVPEAISDARREADEGSAMAAAMTTVAPVDGKANRIGFNTATYNGTTALALSYSRAAGDVDFNVGVAMAGDNAMVKAGAGFSW